ncbi:MAG: ATP-binding protein [Deltaproteobacteria bacterium]|nr:ATP-binding protein [Deltaproteobacteria bacterium]
MKYYQRTLSQAIRKAIKTFPAILITGPRQAGKTTLLKTEYAGTHRFLSFENPDVRERALTDPNGFFEQYKPPLILDEIQYVPEILNYLKTRIDENRKPGQWMLTGSQNFSLMQNVSQSLAGRVAVLTLLPFSIPESRGLPSERSVDAILQDLFNTSEFMPSAAKVKRISFINWLVRGAYPELRANPKVDKQIWCSSYIQTYLERDIRQILNVGDLHTFSRFLKLCAAHTAQMLNLSDLARDTGVSVPTAKRWLSALVASHQVYLLPQYYKNFGKRITKSPKLYFLDTALITFLLGLYSDESIMN